jgi:hypothetical protein
MRGKTTLFLLFSVLLLTMCKSYANQPVTHTNGLSCQNYTDYRFFEWHGEEYNFYLREEGADCTYTCSDGTVEQTTISGTISPLYAASKEDLEAEFCGVAASPTPAATASPTPTPTSSPSRPASATATASLATQVPLLSGTVSMCDLGGKLINFKIADSAPDFTEENLEVRISERESSCYVNPTNRSLLTCTIPVGVSFPATIVVRLDGALVNEFVYTGLGCALLTTPTPAARPGLSYP